MAGEGPKRAGNSTASHPRYQTKPREDVLDLARDLGFRCAVSREQPSKLGLLDRLTDETLGRSSDSFQEVLRELLCGITEVVDVLRNP